MSVVFIDTDSELPEDKAKEVNFDEKFLIRMPYTVAGEEKFCGLITKENVADFYKKVREGNMPITSGLNVAIYKEYFEEYFAKGEDILYVSFSSHLSGTFKYLDMAVKELSEKYPKAKFRRYDTKLICMGSGLASYYAIKWHNEGKTNDEIITLLDELCPRINVVFSPDDLFYLKKGGRLSTAAAIAGSMLQIKPMIKITPDGRLVNTGKVSGRMKAIKTIVEETIAGAQDLDKYPILVMNADCEEDSNKILNALKQKLPNADIWNLVVGPVIGTHCGPGTIATIYVGNPRV